MAYVRFLHDRKDSVPVVGGHRGHRSDVRENTVENFRQLQDLGLAYIEIDVQMTADEEIVIFHDQELSHTTSLRGRVCACSLAELRRSFSINTVEEVLRWACQIGMGIGFELKLYPGESRHYRETLVRKLAQLIAQYEFYQDCFVFGKDPDTLRYLRGLDQKVNLAVIAPGLFEQALELMRELDAFMYLDFLSGLDPQKVRRLHEAGYLVDGSVVDTYQELNRARALQVDMIESNEPAYILSLLSGDDFR